MKPLEKHTLVKDLPEHKHTIRHLKMHDAHFAKLFNSYNDLETEVHNIEKDDSRVGDDHIEYLKKRRVQLKDELFDIIQKTEQAL